MHVRLHSISISIIPRIVQENYPHLAHWSFSLHVSTFFYLPTEKQFLLFILFFSQLLFFIMEPEVVKKKFKFPISIVYDKFICTFIYNIFFSFYWGKRNNIFLKIFTYWEIQRYMKCRFWKNENLHFSSGSMHSLYFFFKDIYHTRFEYTLPFFI